MTTEIFDTIEFHDTHLNAIVRANVLGGGIQEGNIYLTVQPTSALLSEQWHKFPMDDTAFRISSDLVTGLDQS